MSNSRKHLMKDHFFKFPRFTGYYGEGVRKRATVRWFKRLANKALRRSLNKDL